MYFDYFSVLVFSAVGLVFVFANMIIASVVRPKRQSDKGLETYECGEETIGDAWIRFDIRYYTVALVYVIFAVEIAFLFPWALVMKSAVNGTGAAVGADVGPLVVVKGFLFITILFIGLAYVWAKGDLDWVLAYNKTPYQPPAERERLNRQSVQELEAALEGKSDDPDGDGDKPDDEEAA